MTPEQERELLEMKIALQRLKILREHQEQTVAQRKHPLNEALYLAEHYLPSNLAWQVGKRLSWKSQIVALATYFLWKSKRK